MVSRSTPKYSAISSTESHHSPFIKIKLRKSQLLISILVYHIRHNIQTPIQVFLTIFSRFQLETTVHNRTKLHKTDFLFFLVAFIVSEVLLIFDPDWLRTQILNLHEYSEIEQFRSELEATKRTSQLKIILN